VRIEGVQVGKPAVVNGVRTAFQLAWPELPPGAFGENLSVSGATEETVCIGDVWSAGSAVLQVASPRKPCRKISRYWRRSDLLQRVHESGRIGWYLRVITEGAVEAGTPISLRERPHPEWPIQRAFSAALARNRSQARALSEVAALSDRWKAWLRGGPARL
jgi:MOSC domain-containing protein YiiM